MADGDELAAVQHIPLAAINGFPDLWGVAATECELLDGTVYWYWFAVLDSDPYQNTSSIRLCTDPFAAAIDRRYLAPDGADSRGGQPASVVLFEEGMLAACDANGARIGMKDDAPIEQLPANNRLVIYELPTRWTRKRTLGTASIGAGTFDDVAGLFAASSPFGDALGLSDGVSYLGALGINAIELLPPADSTNQFDWGYGTANFFAPDYYLGHPDPDRAPNAGQALLDVARHAHVNGARFFSDMVMAFARQCPLRHINYLDFFVQFGAGDPEQGGRDGFGGDLFKFDYWVEGYDPRSGDHGSFVPARVYLFLYLEHWMRTYHVDGLRLDSVNNINNEDFLAEFTTLGHALWRERGGGDDRFLVVAEDFAMPLELVKDGRVDGLWNESFKQIMRHVILGQSWDAEPSFERSVRMLIDCTQLGFNDGSQVVNYLTSHDIGGPGNERFFDWLTNNGVIETEDRIKLAFCCLLTAVGIPMILAGDEFAEQQDLDIVQESRGDTNKQIDPINYERLQEDWRKRVFYYVARLIHFRTSSDALSVNAVEFIHVDVEEDRRILAWRRGTDQSVVVVVANFSDFASADTDDGATEYVVAGWPDTPENTCWREISFDYVVAAEQVGREPLHPWSARIYALESIQ